MAKTATARRADAASRAKAADAAEAAMNALLNSLRAYLDAGSGDSEAARAAVRRWAAWRLSILGAADAPGYPHRPLADLDFETAGA